MSEFCSATRCTWSVRIFASGATGTSRSWIAEAHLVVVGALVVVVTVVVVSVVVVGASVVVVVLGPTYCGHQTPRQNRIRDALMYDSLMLHAYKISTARGRTDRGGGGDGCGGHCSGGERGGGGDRHCSGGHGFRRAPARAVSPTPNKTLCQTPVCEPARHK